MSGVCRVYLYTSCETFRSCEKKKKNSRIRRNWNVGTILGSGPYKTRSRVHESERYIILHTQLYIAILYLNRISGSRHETSIYTRTINNISFLRIPQPFYEIFFFHVAEIHCHFVSFAPRQCSGVGDANPPRFHEVRRPPQARSPISEKSKDQVAHGRPRVRYFVLFILFFFYIRTQRTRWVRNISTPIGGARWSWPRCRTANRCSLVYESQWSQSAKVNFRRLMGAR